MLYLHLEVYFDSAIHFIPIIAQVTHKKSFQFNQTINSQSSVFSICTQFQKNSNRNTIAHTQQRDFIKIYGEITIISKKKITHKRDSFFLIFFRVS